MHVSHITLYDLNVLQEKKNKIFNVSNKNFVLKKPVEFV